MTIVIVLIVICFVICIGYFALSFGKKIKTRKEYLQDIAAFVHSKVDQIEGQDAAYRINFTFEGEELTYEDHLVPGFKDVVNKGYLKTQIEDDFSLQFSEKTNNTKLLSGDTKLFNKTNAGYGQQSLKIPSKLKAFSVECNDTNRLINLFQNTKFVSILSRYKNVDPRGFNFMALKIVNGLITLNFYTENRYNPSIETVSKNVHLLEDPIKDLINLTKIISQTK